MHSDAYVLRQLTYNSIDTVLLCLSAGLLFIAWLLQRTFGNPN